MPGAGALGPGWVYTGTRLAAEICRWASGPVAAAPPHVRGHWRWQAPHDRTATPRWQAAAEGHRHRLPPAGAPKKARALGSELLASCPLARSYSLWWCRACCLLCAQDDGEVDAALWRLGGRQPVHPHKCRLLAEVIVSYNHSAHAYNRGSIPTPIPDLPGIGGPAPSPSPIRRGSGVHDTAHPHPHPIRQNRGSSSS